MTMNGAIPDALLGPLCTPGRADILAAVSFDDMLAHARAEGVHLTGTTTEQHAYRTLEQQEDLFFDRYQTTYCEYAPGKVDKRYYQGRAYYRKPGASAAAVPGTSNHGLGLAVDFQNLGGFGGVGYNWLARNAYVYGWDNAEGASVNEPWHWTYKHSNDHHEPPGPPKPRPDERTPDVRVVRATDTNNYYRVGETTFVQLGNMDQVNAEVAAWGPIVETSSVVTSQMLRDVQAAQAQLAAAAKGGKK